MSLNTDVHTEVRRLHNDGIPWITVGDVVNILDEDEEKVRASLNHLTVRQTIERKVENGAYFYRPFKNGKAFAKAISEKEDEIANIKTAVQKLKEQTRVDRPEFKAEVLRDLAEVEMFAPALREFFVQVADDYEGRA